MRTEQDLFDALQEHLLQETSQSIELPDFSLPGFRELEQARAQILVRFWHVYQASKIGQAGQPDLLILLRQLVRTYGSVFFLQSTWQQLTEKAPEFGLMGRESATGIVEISTMPWQPDWLPNSHDIDLFELRSIDEKFIGDGIIASMNEDWTYYRSGAQKAAVDTWMFAPPGSTTLVSLPTGAGKSLCTILPAWYESHGGEIAKGTTIVIVPTVALAYDQQKQARRFFDKARGDLFEPVSRTGGTSLDERKDIEQAILDGTLPILYTSPESLIQSNLYYTCLKAARQGLITRLVIDEAHLIETWGADFRPEFQLLSTYRRLLLQASKGKLKTLLLSATVTPDAFETLAQLFSEQNSLITVQANRLRNEIEYYFNFSSTEHTRQKRVLEALKHLPRPLILYVTQPEQAETWLHKLRNEGYQRLDVFHGETPSAKRHELIEAWSADKLDIMVATSAFGLGIDKSHVRTVIHATLPENLDRLYQEVGRGGRDGYRSVSLTCITEEDHRLALSLMPKRLTVEKAYQRWRAILDSAQNHPESEGIVVVNRDATRKDEPTMQAGQANQGWNFQLLLMMQRARMIEIAEVPPPNSQNEQTINWLPIRVLRPEIYTSQAEFELHFSIFRTSEIAAIEANIKKLFQLIDGYSQVNSPHEALPICLASQIGSMYERSQRTCSGCPVCRHMPLDERPYSFKPIKFHIDYPEEMATKVPSHVSLDEVGSLKLKIQGWQQFSLTWDGINRVSELRSKLKTIAAIFWKGFEQIIYPEELFEDEKSAQSFIRSLADREADRRVFPHRILPLTWVIQGLVPLFALNTLVIYPTDKKLAFQLFNYLMVAKIDGIRFPAILNIVHGDQRFEDERRFLDVVDGLNEPLDWFIKTDQESEDEFTLF